MAMFLNPLVDEHTNCTNLLYIPKAYPKGKTDARRDFSYDQILYGGVLNLPENTAKTLWEETWNDEANTPYTFDEILNQYRERDFNMHQFETPFTYETDKLHSIYSAILRSLKMILEILVQCNYIEKHTQRQTSIVFYPSSPKDTHFRYCFYTTRKEKLTDDPRVLFHYSPKTYHFNFAKRRLFSP